MHAAVASISLDAMYTFSQRLLCFEDVTLMTSSSLCLNSFVPNYIIAKLEQDIINLTYTRT